MFMPWAKASAYFFRISFASAGGNASAMMFDT